MTTNKQKQFGKWAAFIEPNEDREGVNCYIEHLNGDMGSLACADGEGLVGDTIISTKTIDTIARWAESNGY